MNKTTDISTSDIKLNFNKDVMISHEKVLDLLRITLLVYNYGEEFKVINKDETIEQFINRASDKIENLDISEERKKILLNLKTTACSGKVCKFISNKETDVQTGITINDKDKRICVVFRGSESLYDWYYDLNIFKHTLSDNIKVHKGFYTQLTNNGVCDSLIEEVKNKLKEYPNYEIFITGHSLGAALSTLFGYILSHDIDELVTVVSFASPRVGNKYWKNAFEKKKNLMHYRVTNNKDIVTAFPTFRYRHVGTNIRVTDTNVETFFNYQDNSWYDFSIFRCWRISDHSGDLYYNNLIKNTW